MSCDSATAYRAVRPVTISYADLKDKSKDLSAEIEQGFGPNGLGMISISYIHGYSLLRQHLLQLAPRVTCLLDEEKSSLEDPESRYNIGWSHRKDILESGKLGTSRGFFYANPILDVPTTDALLIQRYPQFCRPNKWPTTALPELEVAYKALGKTMLDVGLMLAYHCDKYVSKAIHGDEGLEQILKHSRSHKGSLLHYLPKQRSDCTEHAGSMASWCGWHTDFSSLTGLTCGMYTKNAEKITCPDSAAGQPGLYIRTRDEEIVKAVIGENDLAYQLGELAEILSEGHLCATPHCVKAPSGEKAVGVERSTFALFMQPNWDQKLKFPAVIQYHEELFPPNGSLTYGEYAAKIAEKYSSLAI